MKVLVDTSVWSAVLRRDAAAAVSHRAEMQRLLAAGVVEIIGPIRQEILSGIRESAKFQLVRDRLRAFIDLPIRTSDHETAAELYNRCRAKGIQGTGTDMLICAIAIRDGLTIFTDDRDFQYYQKALPIRLHEAT